MTNLNSLLEQARQPLPPGIIATDEQILIAGTPRRELKTAHYEAGVAANAARVSFDASGSALETASQAYLAVTPALEHLDPTAVIRGQLSADVREKLGELEQATNVYRGTRKQHNITQQQLELSQRTRREARRLSRIPRAILAVTTTALISGAAIHDEQVLHDGAKAAIASGTVQAGTKEWVRDEESASNSQRDILDAWYLGGATVGGVAVWFLVGDRPARPRARLIVRRAKNQSGNS